LWKVELLPGGVFPRGFICGNRFIIQETGRQMVEEQVWLCGWFVLVLFFIEELNNNTCYSLDTTTALFDKLKKQQM
jgi:hypothetical protein